MQADGEIATCIPENRRLNFHKAACGAQKSPVVQELLNCILVNVAFSSGRFGFENTTGGLERLPVRTQDA